MTPEQFDAAIAGTRITPPMRTAARRVLVDGMAPADAARDAGIKPQQLNQTLRRIESELGLITVSATLPEKHVGALKKWISEHGGIVD